MDIDFAHSPAQIEVELVPGRFACWFEKRAGLFRRLFCPRYIAEEVIDP